MKQRTYKCNHQTSCTKLQNPTPQNTTRSHITFAKTTPKSFQITLYFCNRVGDMPFAKRKPAISVIYTLFIYINY